MILSKDSGVDARFVLSDLFDRSIIGNISPHKLTKITNDAKRFF